MTTEDFAKAEKQLFTATERYVGAVCRESSTADRRSLVRSEAITRIMMLNDPQKEGKKYSATAATELVMMDAGYVSQRLDESEAVSARIRAETDVFVAKQFLVLIAHGGAV